MLVVLEEEGGDISEVEIVTVNRNTICSVVDEDYPSHVKSWSLKKKEGTKSKLVGENLGAFAHLRCPDKLKIVNIDFASFGDPFGACGNYVLGECNSPITKQVVEQV